jgi:hypothetical protein
MGDSFLTIRCLLGWWFTVNHEIGERAGAILLKQFKLFLPVQSPFKKYSRSLLTQITHISIAVPSHRGAARDRHERGAGCDGRGRRY